MPEFAWPVTYGLCRTEVVLCLSTVKHTNKKNYVFLPCLPHSSATAPIVKCRMFVYALVKIHCIYTHTHALLICEGQFWQKSSDAWNSASITLPAPWRGMQHLCSLLGEDSWALLHGLPCSKQQSRELRCASTLRTWLLSWPVTVIIRIVVLIPILRYILWGCKEAPPVPSVCTTWCKELSNLTSPTSQELAWSYQAMAIQRFNAGKKFKNGRLESTVHID